MLKVGDLVILEKVWYVYELLDDQGLVFYVGMTKDPTVRLREHLIKGSKHVADIIKVTHEPRMRIVGVHASRSAAERDEKARIRSTPGVVNIVGFGPDPAIKKAAMRRKHLRREARRKAGLSKPRNKRTKTQRGEAKV